MSRPCDAVSAGVCLSRRTGDVVADEHFIWIDVEQPRRPTREFMTSQLMEYLNRQPRIGAIGTASRDGMVDIAVMSSPRMVDETTVVLGAGQNRSLANLRENPNAVFIIVEPAADPMAWKGIRVYLTLKDLAISGPAFAAFMAEFVKAAGEAARSMVHAVATFEVTEVRPLLDIGQGWEQSI